MMSSPSSAAITLEAAERLQIVRALEACNGNRSMAAQRLGIGRTTLYRKLKEYGLE
jgi:two-component system response regulator HydG